jgi:DNA polymerase III epsilon subunit-like protein
MAFVFYDLETTGLSPTSDRVIEVGACYGKETFQVIINPHKPSHPAAEAVHGITSEMIQASGISEYDGIKSFFDWME